jgi:ABC-type uncharacterized transport system substrate-binding protein
VRLAAGTQAPGTRARLTGADLAPTRLGLLHQLAPSSTVIGLLLDSNLGDAASQVREVQTAADTTGLKLIVLHAATAADIDAAFATLAAQQVGGLVVGSSAFSSANASS